MSMPASAVGIDHPSGAGTQLQHGPAGLERQATEERDVVAARDRARVQRVVDLDVQARPLVEPRDGHPAEDQARRGGYGRFRLEPS